MDHYTKLLWENPTINNLLRALAGKLPSVCKESRMVMDKISDEYNVMWVETENGNLFVFNDPYMEALRISFDLKYATHPNVRKVKCISGVYVAWVYEVPEVIKHAVARRCKELTSGTAAQSKALLH